MAKGYVTEFRYCSKIALGIKEYGKLDNLIDYELGMARSDRAFIFTDNHDNQRGHGAGGIWTSHDLMSSQYLHKSNDCRRCPYSRKPS